MDLKNATVAYSVDINWVSCQRLCKQHSTCARAQRARNDEC